MRKRTDAKISVADIEAPDRPTSAPLNDHETDAFVGDEVTNAQLAGAVAHNLDDLAHAGVNNVLKLNLLKKDNRKNLQAAGTGAFSFLVKMTADPMEDAIKMGVRFDETKVEVLTQMLAHSFFLAVFCVALFVRLDTEQPYRMQYAAKEVILDSEIAPQSNVYFKDITTIPQIYAFASYVLMPALYQDSFYNDVKYPATTIPPDKLNEDGSSADGTKREPYEGFYFEDSSLTLGSVRVRQVRSQAVPCTNPNSTSFLSRMGDCHAYYVRNGPFDVRTIVDLWEETNSTDGTVTTHRDVSVAKHTTEGEFGEEFEYRSENNLEDDGPWQSPITLINYDAGGFVVDLPVGVAKSTARLDELFQSKFIDAGTRALFLDYSLYNANSDQFLSCRILFEFLPSGVVLPFAELIPAALLKDVRAFEQDGSSVKDLVQVCFEFLLYILIIAYLTRASDNIAQYPSFLRYLANPWNSLDMLNVACFVAVTAIRIFWMINAAKFQYVAGDEFASDKTDDNAYNPLRLAVVYYSYGKTFFAFGTLLSFIKTFRYIGVSRRLTAFTETLTRATADMGLMMLVFAIVLAGFSIAFHIAFGQQSRDFKDFPSSALSLLLLALGDFDAQALRIANPVMGMILFGMYAVFMTFIILTMMLKIVDNAFNEMRAELFETRDMKENLGLQMRLAIRKIFYDYYWWFKVNRVIKSAKVTEKLISKMNKAGQMMKDKSGLGSDAALLDDSIADLISADKQKKEADEAAAKEEAKRVKEEEKKKKKKTMSRSDRKKRKGEREQITTNLPENRKLVRAAIKEGRISDIKEEDIDPLEITDRLDMMSHRSDILNRSALRLLDQVMIMVEDGKEGIAVPDNDAMPTKVKPVMATYGKTGDMFGLRGVSEPVMDDDQKITDLDLDVMENQSMVLPVPKIDEQVKELGEEPKNAVGDGDVIDMYKTLGFEEEAKLAQEKADLHHEEQIAAMQKEGKG